LTILLLPFATLAAGDEVSAKLARQVARLIGADLERACANHGLKAKYLSSRGTAESGKAALAATTEMPSLTDMMLAAEMYGADLVCAGQLAVRDRDVHFEVHLAKPKQQAMLFAKRYETFPSYFFDALEEVKLRISQSLGLQLTDEERVDLFQRPTESWQALLYYLLAEDERYGLTIGVEPFDLLQPIELYRESLTVDPAFALAKNGLAHYLVLLLERSDISAPDLRGHIEGVAQYLDPELREVMREVIGLPN
jgi:hypothetical protein